MRWVLLAAGAALAPPPLPSLPVLSRVRVEAQPSHLVVTEDVRMSRGDWSAGDLDLYVAFGAPGVPHAFDAHLIPLDDAVFAADPRASGELVQAERAARRPPRARLLLGRESMAGVVVHLKEPALRRAFAAGGALVLRLRSLIPTLGSPRDLVVRLGTDGAPPIVIGAIEVEGARATAKLCGPRADPYPLAVTSAPKPPLTFPRPLAPALAARHEGDDLCLVLTDP